MGRILPQTCGNTATFRATLGERPLQRVVHSGSADCGHSEIDLFSLDQMAVVISIGAAILNAVLLPKVAIIGSGTSHYYIVAIPLLLAFPVGLITGGISKKWSLESVFFCAIVSTFLLIIAISWIEVLHVKLDNQEPAFRAVAMTSKFIAGGKSRRPHRVFFRMPNSESMGELPVSREIFESVQVGDLLSLKIGDGYFGMPWVKGAPMATSNRSR